MSIWALEVLDFTKSTFCGHWLYICPPNIRGVLSFFSNLMSKIHILSVRELMHGCNSNYYCGVVICGMQFGKSDLKLRKADCYATKLVWAVYILTRAFKENEKWDKKFMPSHNYLFMYYKSKVKSNSKVICHTVGLLSILNFPQSIFDMVRVINNNELIMIIIHFINAVKCTTQRKPRFGSQQPIAVSSLIAVVTPS